MGIVRFTMRFAYLLLDALFLREVTRFKVKNELALVGDNGDGQR